MKDRDLLKLAALNGKIDKEGLRRKILSGKKRTVFWISPKTASVAASLIIVIACAAFFIRQAALVPENGSESSLSCGTSVISGVSADTEASDTVFITSLPNDGEIVIEDSLKKDLELVLENGGEAYYRVKVRIYSPDFEKYKSEKIDGISEPDSAQLKNIETQYRLIEEEYFKSLGFDVDDAGCDSLSFIITGKAGQILTLTVPEGKAFFFSKCD